MRENVKRDKNRLHFHMMPPTGWMSDPNGLCQFHGVNHIYFQYTPFLAGWGTKLWGHYTTKDWIHYTEEEPFLFPDTKWDRDGVYSGSACVKEDGIHYFYTGNVKLQDKEYDYIMNGREQNTMHLFSPDGKNITVKELVMTNEDYPSNMSKHVRDPKIYEKDGSYYMIQGGRDDENRGCALLFQSDNLRGWKWYDTVYSKQPFGYMWECPDLFEIDGKQIMTCCPQGVEQQGYEYQNVYQCGYFPVNFELENKKYELGEFTELDKGFDIYATQTFEDEKGRRILIGWMGIPDADYDNNATVQYDWIHALTMPRELSLKDGKILQKPLKEMQQLRKNKFHCNIAEFENWEPEDCCFELHIDFENDNKPKESEISDGKKSELRQQNRQDTEKYQEAPMTLQLREDVFLSWKDGLLSLKMGQSGHGRKERIAQIDALRNLTIFSDTSAIEIFINDGETVMTTRVYSEHLNQKVQFLEKGNVSSITGYELGSFIVERT